MSAAHDNGAYVQSEAVLDTLFGVESEFKVGSWHIWEPRLPHARAVVRVSAVKTNADGETWVETTDQEGRKAWNELERMREACVPFTRWQRLRSWWASRSANAR